MIDSPAQLMAPVPQTIPVEWPTSAPGAHKIDGLVQERLMHWSYVFLALTHRDVSNLIEVDSEH